MSRNRATHGLCLVRTIILSQLYKIVIHKHNFTVGDALYACRRRVSPKSETRFAKIGDVRETRRWYTDNSRRNHDNQPQQLQRRNAKPVAPTGFNQYPSYPKGDSL